MAGTRLTGCLPAPLSGVATTDAAAQGLAACQAGPAFGAPRYDWILPAGLPVGAAVGQVQATDARGRPVCYELTAGNDAGVFELDATTGILSVAGALPTGGASLTVTATDAQGGATRVPVVVAVADAAGRAPPLFPAAGWSFRVAEDAPVGTPVGTAAALDLDGGPLTYALTAGNAAGAFALDTTSGTLTVAGALDYETTASYALTLTASDAQGGTATVAISVTDIAYAPSFAAASLTFTVDETAAVGTAVGVVQALDPAGGTVRYALTAGNAAGAFAIDAATGTLTVAYDRWPTTGGLRPVDEAAAYDLYVREHDTGTYGTAALQTRGEYEAALQAQVAAAEAALSDEIGGREAVVFLAPMGAHNAIGFEAWQAVAQWAVATDDANVVQAIRDDTPEGDPEHTQTLANLTSRTATAAGGDGTGSGR